MSLLSVIKLTHANSLSALIDQGDQYQVANSLANLLMGLAGGAYAASMDLQLSEGNAAASSGTVTFSGVGAANDTILINGVTLTAVAGAPGANQWQVGGTATASALNLKNAINASASALISQHVSATSALGVVTISAKNKGASGNAITLAEGVDANNHMAESGARLSGGSDATANVFHFGA